MRLQKRAITTFNTKMGKKQKYTPVRREVKVFRRAEHRAMGLHERPMTTGEEGAAHKREAMKKQTGMSE